MDTTTVDSARPTSPYRANPVFWIMCLLPAAAVVGGIATLVIALRGADRALPAAYHWEGEHLDRDFARARTAAAHEISASIEWQASARECTASLRNAPDDPQTLTMLFANGADAALDRVMLLRRAQPGLYRGVCAPLPEGRWRVMLENAAGTWAIRAQIAGAPARIELRARDPGGGS